MRTRILVPDELAKMYPGLSSETAMSPRESAGD